MKRTSIRTRRSMRSLSNKNQKKRNRDWFTSGAKKMTEFWQDDIEKKLDTKDSSVKQDKVIF